MIIERAGPGVRPFTHPILDDSMGQERERQVETVSRGRQRRLSGRDSSNITQEGSRGSTRFESSRGAQLPRRRWDSSRSSRQQP